MEERAGRFPETNQGSNDCPTAIRFWSHCPVSIGVTGLCRHFLGVFVEWLPFSKQRRYLPCADDVALEGVMSRSSRVVVCCMPWVCFYIPRVSDLVPFYVFYFHSLTLFHIDSTPSTKTTTIFHNNILQKIMRVIALSNKHSTLNENYFLLFLTLTFIYIFQIITIRDALHLPLVSPWNIAPSAPPPNQVCTSYQCPFMKWTKPRK